jgi:hypothetical protein
LKKYGRPGNILAFRALMRNFRVLTGSITMLAWFVISNHCMLDAAISPVTQVMAQKECCPMHTSQPSAPAKPKEPGGLQLCCKNLPAMAVKSLQVRAHVVAPLLGTFPEPDRVVAPGQDEQPLLCLDTGPPGAFSFSELVLQRSLLAHAPPSVA